MAKGLEDAGGCAVTFIGFAAFMWFITAPDKDQVCRSHTVWVMDGLHGVDGQPTCQELIDQLDAQAAESREKISDLTSRVESMESKLNM